MNERHLTKDLKWLHERPNEMFQLNIGKFIQKLKSHTLSSAEQKKMF